MKKNHFMLLWVLTCLFSLPQISYGQLSFNSTPVTTATVSVPYTYSSFAADGTSNAPTMTCPTKPAWLNFAASGSTSMVTFGPTITNPGGIAGDSDGNTYVVQNNTSNSYIYKIAPDGTANTTWAAVDNGYIYAMNVDSGYLYVSYYNNAVTGGSSIKKISLTNPGAGQTLVYQHPSQGLLSLVFRGGFIYCANWDSNSILKINPTNGTSTVYLSVSNPFGLGFDASGLLYIALYSSGQVSMYDGVTLTTKVSGLSYPSDVKIDANGNIYVSQSMGGGIIKYNSTFTTNNVLVPLISTNRIWGMNLSPTGSLVFGLNSQNTCARIGTGAVLSGTPSSADIGPHNVTITATNATETVSQNFIVTVQGPPTITNFPNLTGAVGTDITLTDPTSNSSGAFTYTSSNTAVATISGNTVTPLTAGSTTITATQASSGNYMQGTISCTLTVSNCTPVAITSQPITQTTCIGSTASFTVGATGTGLSYQWRKGAANITNATAATLSLTSVSSADVANYSCVVTGTCGSATSSAVALNTDATLPTITAPANVNATTNTACTATGVALGTPTTADNCSVSSVTNNHASTTYPLGVTTVTWTVTDSAGNTATATQTVTVTDNVNPTITAPATVNATTNTACTATGVSLGTPVTADNCSVASVTNDHASTTYPLGATTVIWTVTDGAGRTATATQTVNVTDIVNPTITAPADVNTTTNTACTATGVALGTPVTADNCSVASVTNDAPATFPLGDTTVTWTVTDGSGNTATTTQLVSVGDVMPPVVKTKNATVYLNNLGQAIVTPAMIDNGTTDNCDFSLIVSPNNFVCGN
ncbi:MAG: HYR domain-containing protein, partial [Flavobacterium sp.]|nr:HYR domain-containing protein [Flavobacterium sp.]